MRIIGSSHIGKVRKENQDAFWFFQPAPEICAGVVCDGMGGARGGSRASAIAVETARRCFQATPQPEHIEPLFRRIVEESNRCVHDEAAGNPELTGMGTTMVLTLAIRDQVFFANVGDSRGYHIEKGGIRQITKDHSAVQELVDSGHITQRQARIHPNKNIITRAIGIEKNVVYDFYQITVVTGDIIILCSDGLSNFVDENEIQFEASGGSFDDLPKRLIDLANSRGGADNITVVAIQV